MIALKSPCFLAWLPREQRSRARRALFVAAALFGSISLSPLDAGAQILTLEEIEAKAQRPRPELDERQAAIARAQAELGVVQSSSAPMFAGRVDATLAPGGRMLEIRNPKEPDDIYFVQGSRGLGESEAFLPVPRYAAVLGGKLTLLDFGRTRLGVRAAEAAISAERASLIQAKVELVRQAREAYLLWLEAHQTWQLAERDAEVTAARTVSVRELISEGARPATDATLSAYDEQLARLRQARAERAVEAALQALSTAIQNELPPRSVPDLEVIEAEPAPEPPASDRPPEGPPKKAPDAAPKPASDPALTALERQHQAALSAARAADHAGAPTLDASAELGIQGQDVQVFPAYRVGLSLSIPLWDGGRQTSQAAVHRAEAQGMEARLQALTRAVRAREEAAQSRHRASSAELRLSLMLLATAELMLSEAEEHYRSGSDTLERVLGAQRSLVQARREVLTAKLETARARLELTPVKVEAP
jgi:outer membrane protein